MKQPTPFTGMIPPSSAWIWLAIALALLALLLASCGQTVGAAVMPDEFHASGYYGEGESFGDIQRPGAGAPRGYLTSTDSAAWGIVLGWTWKIGEDQLLERIVLDIEERGARDRAEAAARAVSVAPVTIVVPTAAAEPAPDPLPAEDDEYSWLGEYADLARGLAALGTLAVIVIAGIRRSNRGGGIVSASEDLDQVAS